MSVTVRLRKARRGAAFLAVVAAALLPGPAGARPAFEHITMDRSVPADGEKVGQVNEIRLFFSGAPLMRGASVRVVNSARSLMRSSPPAADATDSKQLFVTIDPTLPPGTYVVQWRCIADDGHVMRGDFTFEVTAE
ncbi:MAG: copper resistance protein CopC [Gemmatimonadetes bacterium]|nr:copper resistance protein CopC [Gemmatimonadota bacterium]